MDETSQFPEVSMKNKSSSVLSCCHMCKERACGFYVKNCRMRSVEEHQIVYVLTNMLGLFILTEKGN